MQRPMTHTHRESPYTPPPVPAPADPCPFAGQWPIPPAWRGVSPEVRRAALEVLRTTARDWGLAARG